MKYNRWIAWGLCAALALGMLGGCTSSGRSAGGDDGAQSTASGDNTAAGSDQARTPAQVDLTDAVTVTLSGTGAQIDGAGADVSDGVITVSAGGTYVFRGSLSEGRILVDAGDAEVVLVFDDADITCSYGSPLYIYKSARTTLHLMEDTENSLTDGTAYTFEDRYSSAADEEPNACLYSKSDLVIQGAGALSICANYNNGVTSKDTLEIYDLSLTVDAVNHGVNGKDSLLIDSAGVTVTCGGDALRSTNDTDAALGWVQISQSALVLEAGEDGVQAEGALTLSNVSCTIRSGGGSGVQPSDDASAKGLKAGGSLTLYSGTYTLDCSDDAVHSNGDVSVSGGVYAVSSGDDAFHADEALTVSGGEIDVLTCYEGLEGSSVTVSGGSIRIVSTDDGVNAAGGADSSGFGGFGHGNTFGAAGGDYFIDISGGSLVVTAGGDGLDSNGSITLSGGSVSVCSTGTGDGALDYESSFALTGGTLFAVDAGNMGAVPSQASQYTVCIGFGAALSAGTYVALEGTEQSFVFQLPIDGVSMVFSSPELEGGAAYTVSCGGEYTGETADGVGSGGTYSGGTQLTELTLSDYLTTYGNLGMGGMGGMGGRPGGMGGMFGGMGEAPGGEMPNGELPDGAAGGRGGMGRGFSGDASGELPEGIAPESAGASA